MFHLWKVERWKLPKKKKKKKGEEAKKLQKQTTKYHKYNYDLFIIKNVAKFG